MKFKTSKSCKLCEKDFECNSNAQKYCGDCKGEARLKRNRVYNKAYYRENSDEIDSKHTAYNKGERGKAAEKLRAAVRSGKIERGDGFQDLRHGAWVDDDTFDHDKWAASTRTHDCDCDDPDRKDSKFHVNWEYAVGDSPEEAVAKLWLEMKEKGEIQDK